MSRFVAVDEDARWKDLIAYLECLSELPVIQDMRRAAMDVLSAGDPRRGLDLGCGIGDVTSLLSGLWSSPEVIGMDVSRRMVAAARDRYPSLTFVHGDALALPLDLAGMDFCYAERLFIHVESPSKCVGEIRRVLRPGCAFASIEPTWSDAELDCGPALDGAAFLDSYRQHIRQPDAPAVIADACRRQGFCPVLSRAYQLQSGDFDEADRVIRFENAFSRSGAVAEGCAIRAGFRSYVLPMTLQVWTAA